MRRNWLRPSAAPISPMWKLSPKPELSYQPGGSFRERTIPLSRSRRISRASPSSGVVTIPPSPVVIVLAG